MAEISRAECINTINKWISCSEYDTDECLSSICNECKNYYDGDVFYISLKQAISDMEKIEKIEKLMRGEQNE